MSDLASTSEKDGGLPASDNVRLRDIIETIQYVANNCMGQAGMKTIHELCDVGLDCLPLAPPAPAESGEPAGWLISHKQFPTELEPFVSCADPLTPADREAGFTATLLYAHPPAESAGSPSTSGVGVTDEMVVLASEAFWASITEIQITGAIVGFDAGIRAALVAALSSPPDPSRDTQPALLSTDETKEGGNG